MTWIISCSLVIAAVVGTNAWYVASPAGPVMYKAVPRAQRQLNPLHYATNRYGQLVYRYPRLNLRRVRAPPPLGSPQRPIGAPGQAGAPAPPPPVAAYAQAAPTNYVDPRHNYEVDYRYLRGPYAPPTAVIDYPDPPSPSDRSLPDPRRRPSKPEVYDCLEISAYFNSRYWNCNCNNNCDAGCRHEYRCMEWS